MEIKEILDAGAAIAEVTDVNGVPYLVVPGNYTLHDLEKTLENPTRKRGCLQFDDAESFVLYVNDHKGREGVTRIFQRDGSFTCVFDHHGEDFAGWGGHKATYAPVKTEEWKRWVGKNKLKMSQSDFAEFLEENQQQIVTPAGAEVLEVATRLEAVKSVNFLSGVRLDNGNQAFRYEETTEARAGTKGELQVPSQFQIGLALFEGGDGYRVTARLRYRIEEKQLKLWYELVNPHLIVKDAILAIGLAIESATKIKPLNGQP